MVRENILWPYTAGLDWPRNCSRSIRRTGAWSSCTASSIRTLETGRTVSSRTYSVKSTNRRTRTKGSISCSMEMWTRCGSRTWTLSWTTTSCWRWPTERGFDCRSTVRCCSRWVHNVYVSIYRLCNVVRQCSYLLQKHCAMCCCSRWVEVSTQFIRIYR